MSSRPQHAEETQYIGGLTVLKTRVLRAQCVSAISRDYYLLQPDAASMGLKAAYTTGSFYSIAFVTSNPLTGLPFSQ